MNNPTLEPVSLILPFRTRTQARLRRSNIGDLDLCSSCNLTAASPLGSVVRPVSISLTEEGVSPTSTPISAKVMPLLRRSVMRDAHVIMEPKIRQAVDISQRLSVTALRENDEMPKPPGMPDHTHTLGARVRFWREHRGMSRRELSKRVGYKGGGLSDLELGESKKSEVTHLIAAELKLNPHYLETGKGEPELGFAQEPPPEPNEWPFPAVPQSRLKKYDNIEQSYLETKLIQGINDLEEARRKRRG